MLEEQYKQILLRELIPALGCTEPIAIALAAAKARDVLGVPRSEIDAIDVYCSGNIVKNVKGVTVPNSGGQRGIPVAIAMGLVGGDANKGLEVLNGFPEDRLPEVNQVLVSDLIKIHLIKGEENLYLRVEMQAGTESSLVEIKSDHTRFNKIYKNDQVLLDNEPQHKGDTGVQLEDDLLTLKQILAYAGALDFEANPDLKQALERQIEFNQAIAKEGLEHTYGAEVGRTVLANGDAESSYTKARAMAAAGSDARMGGSPLPVVINSGSGNQGMTASLPVIVFAQDLEQPHDKLLRALVISNLMAIHQKHYIGKLSAFCGVVNAAVGAGVGIAYLLDMSYDQMSMIVTNTLGTIGGMVCDGAKSSCAAKISMALENVFMAIQMAQENRVFQYGEGLVGADVEETIKNIGRMAHEGMRETDWEILNIMTE